MSEIFEYIKIFTNPVVLKAQLKYIAPDIALVVLLALIILRFLGFEGVTKYIALTLVIAVIIAIL